LRPRKAPSTAYARIVAFLVIILPMTWASAQPGVGSEFRQFDTPIPPTPDFVEPFTATPPVATPIPTVEPGQYFEEDEEDLLPEVARPDLLESEDLGYSAILGQEGMFLVWSVDDDGNRHYYVLEGTSDYFIRIKDIIDSNLEARRQLDATNPYLGLVWSGVKTIAGEIVTGFCGAAGLATIFEVPPVGAAFLTCGLGAGAFTFASVDEFLSINNSLRAFDRRTEDDRKAIEGIFREIDAAPPT
jgi:hypothetical protein